jgi:hypothetical protein
VASPMPLLAPVIRTIFEVGVEEVMVLPEQ